MIEVGSRRGGILIYMLGVVALLSVVVTEFLVDVAEHIRYQTQVEQSDDLGILARSYMEVSLASMHEIGVTDGKLLDPEQGWGDPLEYSNVEVPEGYVVRVGIEDLTGRIPLLKKNSALWNEYFRSLGIGSEDASNVTLGIEEYVFEPVDVVGPAGAKTLKSRPIFSLLELKGVPAFEKFFFDDQGRPNDLFEKFRGAFALYHKENINVNTIPEGLWEVVYSIAPSSDKAYYESVDDFKINSGALTRDVEVGVEAKVLRVNVEVARGPNQYLLSAIVSRNGDGKKPFKILDLVEGFSIL